MELHDHSQSTDKSFALLLLSCSAAGCVCARPRRPLQVVCAQRPAPLELVQSLAEGGHVAARHLQPPFVLLVPKKHCSFIQGRFLQ